MPYRYSVRYVLEFLAPKISCPGGGYDNAIYFDDRIGRLSDAPLRDAISDDFV